MSLHLDPIYVIYLLIAASAGLFAEGAYLLCFSGASYRKSVNRRLKLLKDEPNRENILVQLRKERGLTGAGNYRLGLESLNRLVLQSGLTIGLARLLTFVAIGAVAIQGSTGGNLGEILENLSGVIRQRFKMRRKIRALAAEGRASALILSALPIGIFLMIQIVAPDFYAGVWHEPLTKKALAAAGAWMGIGNLIMYRMVNFRI